MSKELFINFMRGKGLEPTHQDVKHFELMAKSLLEDEIEELQNEVDDAHELLSQLRENGDYDSEWDEKITTFLVKR